MEISEYFGNQRINLTGPVNDKMIEDLDRQVKTLVHSEEPAPTVLTLTSSGGSVGYARAIHDELELLQQQLDLTFVARGICLSAAVTIAMAFPPERRIATPKTKFLIHEGSRNAAPEFTGALSAREIQVANFLTDFQDDKQEGKWVIGVIASGCDRSHKEIRQLSRNGLWLVGQKAVEFGLVSKLLA